MTTKPHFLVERCTGCGLCLPGCPAHALAANGRGAPDFAAEVCLGCGHCLAVCPVGAVVMDGLPRALPLATHIELADLEALLQARRSVRVYQHQPVPRELLERIMETARHAPSACFSECCQFVVLHDAERRRQFVDRLMRRAALMTPLLRLGWLAKPILWLTGCPVRDAGDPRVVRGLFAGVDRWRETGVGFFHNAPVIVIVHTTPDGVQPKECACYAAYHIVLAAQAAGLGSCIIGYAPPILNKMRRHKRDLGIAPRNTVQVVLTLGYPAETFYALPPRAPLSCAWL